MKGYFTVLNPRGQKIADCGVEKDAIKLIVMRNRQWDGHYYQFYPLPGDIIDVNSTNQLPTKDIIVNMDGGVGGSWQEIDHIEVGGQKIPIQQYLPQSDQQPFNLQ
jgi:phage-related protein